MKFSTALKQKVSVSVTFKDLSHIHSLKLKQLVQKELLTVLTIYSTVFGNNSQHRSSGVGVGGEIIPENNKIVFSGNDDRQKQSQPK